jgi:organic radical activating enzyme
MSSKFCSLKYAETAFRLHLDQASSCCRAYPEPLTTGQTVRERIDQWKHEAELLDQGIELPGCNICWNDEKQNKISYRQKKGQSSKQGLLIELTLSNLCNQMCSYCSPQYSSVWEKSIVKDGKFTHVSANANTNLTLPVGSQQVQNRLNEIYDYIHSCDDNSISLSLLGGEPLMQMQSLQTLLSLSQSKIKKLSIVTNLNPPNPKFLKWTLANFSLDKLEVNTSLDATPEFNHVPRAGFDSVKFLKNLELLKSHQLKINFLSTVSVTSIFDLPNFLDWCRANDYSADFSLLNNPDCLNAEIVPIEIRQSILKNIKTKIPAVISNILNHQHSNPLVDLKLFEQYNYLTQYFNRTNTDLTKINNPLFQEYWQWLTEKFKK